MLYGLQFYNLEPEQLIKSSYILVNGTNRQSQNIENVQSKLEFDQKSSRSLSITYQKTRWLHRGDLAGHMFPLPLHYQEPKAQMLYRKIPKQFLPKKPSVITSQWSCRRRVFQVPLRSVLQLIYIKARGR
ncbi:hypothetical protein YC2023_012021 [Brassica napus]